MGTLNKTTHSQYFAELFLEKETMTIEFVEK
jgi:hypothetical protein